MLGEATYGGNRVVMRPSLRAIANAQRGLITRRQCELAGNTQTDLRQMTRKHGPWVIVRIGVYMERSRWETYDETGRLELADRAAHLVMQTEHAMSHDSAARALAIPMLRPRQALVHITREGVRGSRTEGGVKHHLTRIELGTTVDVAGMTVTGRARTALDLAREHGLATGVGALDHIRSCGATDREIDRELVVMAYWPHIRRVRRAVDLSDGRAESLAESLARLFLVEMGFEDIDVQWPVLVQGRAVWTDLRIGCHVVEVDGLQKYLQPGDGGLADRPTRLVLRDERSRQAGVCARGLGMSRLGWDDFFGRARREAMRRVAQECAVTVTRFGSELPAELAEEAARIRRTTPRRRSA